MNPSLVVAPMHEPTSCQAYLYIPHGQDQSSILLFWEFSILFVYLIMLEIGRSTGIASEDVYLCGGIRP